MDIKYVDNDKRKGVIIDWKFLFKEYKKLNCPKDVYNPCYLPIGKAKYFVLLSERKTGKTTNLLLLGLLAYWHFGIVVQYLRSNESMIMNKNIKDIFSTIVQYGYIEKITNGRFNSIYYHAREWKLCKVDENGEIVEEDIKRCMFCLSFDNNETYKSTYNEPFGDFIIIDEFIGKRYRMNEFVDLMDLLSTIIRKRLTAQIFLLANTIDLHSEYFLEFEIEEYVQSMQIGDKDIFTTSGGTNIYVELIKSGEDNTEKSFYNRLYFGFKNPKINAITGQGWAVNNYPHIQRGYKKLQSGIYIDYHNKLLALDIVIYDDIGLCLNCRKATKLYDDSIVYSLKEPCDKRYRYYMGQGNKLDRFIVDMVESHKIRFQNNACGTMFYNHFNMKDAKKVGY